MQKSRNCSLVQIRRSRHSKILSSSVFIACVASLVACSSIDPSHSTTYDQRPVEDDVIYFLITDRFENGDSSNDKGGHEGGKLDHGFDPSSQMFYHGGDLRGLTNRLDYLEDLGVTAIWITPIFGNSIPVQQFGPWTTASYHGYWIADFLNVDPHLGSADDLRNLIDAAHQRDMKIILDIVINHTVDVVKYRECHDPNYDGPGKEGPANACIYRDVEAYPDNAYTPYVDEQNKSVKNPAWLNDTKYYHNRGETTFSGKSFFWGDFSGLDDVFTEHPRVVAGMIEIYQYWIREFEVDGFRIDTAGHVNTEFWSAFVPAMQEHAAAHGRPEFFMFGEVIDTVRMKRNYITKGNLPAILNFDFQKAVTDYVANSGSAKHLADFFADGDYFTDHNTSPYRLPTFLGNHDLGRFGVFLRTANPDESDEINLRRSALAHALLFLTRGIPILYYGDEQGFITEPGFHESREDMFPSATAFYNDNDLIGTDRTTADSNFDQQHPLYRQIQALTALHREHSAFRHGDQVTRYAEDGNGIFAFSRIDPAERVEYLVVVNNSLDIADASISSFYDASNWELLAGDKDSLKSSDDGIVVSVAPLDFAIYRGVQAIDIRETEIAISFADLSNGDSLDCSGFVAARPEQYPTHVEFSIALADGNWQSLGIDRDPPYRTFVDISDYTPGTSISLRARTLGYAVQASTAMLQLTVKASPEHCQ